jgi:secreted trypsin-like serine protease
VLAASLAVVPGAGAQTSTQPSPRIINGTLATRAWPAQGYLNANGSLCGGTLVSGRWFLTAGHCMTSSNPAKYTITLGRSDIDQATPADRYSVDIVERNEAFAGSPPHDDTLLLHISTPVAPPQAPLPIVTPADNALWAPGISATIIGWGKDEHGALQKQLREAQVPMIDDPTCATIWSSSFDPATMVCAGGGVSDTCNGDSGGPLMVPGPGGYVLAGITSWGSTSCATKDTPGVYTRLGAPALNQWVRERIPTAGVAVSPAAPTANQAVTLTATGAGPATAPPAGVPNGFSWDLNNDGVFGDAAGLTATFGPAAPGSYPVSVQATYDDGDRAIGHAVVTIGAAPPPPPPPPPPVVVAPRPVARLVDVPKTVRIAGLLDRRLGVHVQCYAACSLSATLRLDGPTARKIGLTRLSKSVQVATGRARFTKARTATLTLTLPSKSLAKVRKVRTGILALHVTATTGSRHSQLDKAISLRR